jgi:hypothetical protein
MWKESMGGNTPVTYLPTIENLLSKTESLIRAGLNTKGTPIFTL